MEDIQLRLLSQFNSKYREKFNEKLFDRNEDLIIEKLEKLILSCQREQKNFIFKVLNFSVIDNYDDIQKILLEYENSLKKGKNKKKINPYEYIDLKDSDIKLLIVNYHIESKDARTPRNTISGNQNLTMYICIPRVVDKFYFKIAGTYYSTMYQITDSSTFNSSTSKKSKCENIVFRTSFIYLRIYKSQYSLTTVKEEKVEILNYSIGAFSKLFGVFKYILAKYGIYEVLRRLNIGHCVQITSIPLEDDELYTFKTNNKKIFVSIPKVIFNDNTVIQSLICNICLGIVKNAKIEKVFSREYWCCMLGNEFGYNTVDKGESILSSMESSYDQSRREELHLPDKYKGNVYRLLLWMMQEFEILVSKNNLDVSTKKYNYADYVASLYSMKLVTTIQYLSDLATKNKLDIGKILKKLRGIKPSFLINSISKCPLIPYKSNVNDLDSINALRYTYKSIDTKKYSKSSKAPKSTSMSSIYKTVDPSHLGRFDMDSSSKSDPGLSGIFCPLIDVYGNSFSEYEEPVTWDESFDKVMDTYNKTKGLKEVLIEKEKLLGEDNTEKINQVNLNLESMKNILNSSVSNVVKFEESQLYDTIIPLEEGGLIYYVRY